MQAKPGSTLAVSGRNLNLTAGKTYTITLTAEFLDGNTAAASFTATCR